MIVYADDLGQGDLSCYNPKAAYQTPRIDRMAAEGIRFAGVGHGNWKYLDHKRLGGNKYEGDLALHALPEQERD